MNIIRDAGIQADKKRNFCLFESRHNFATEDHRSKAHPLDLQGVVVSPLMK
jgi:hypothetical protein